MFTYNVLYELVILIANVSFRGMSERFSQNFGPKLVLFIEKATLIIVNPKKQYIIKRPL